MYNISQIIIYVIALLVLVISVPTLKKLLAPLLSKIPYVGSLFASTTVTDTVSTTVTDVVPSNVQETIETVKTTVADATGVVK
jgi:hypothetical protein